MKKLLALSALVLLAGVTSATNDDYQKGYDDGFQAGLLACSANMTDEQYSEILLLLEDIRASIDAKNVSLATASMDTGEKRRESKTVDLVIYP